MDVQRGAGQCSRGGKKIYGKKAIMPLWYAQRESTQVTVTRSLSDPGFPGSLCSFHAGSTFPACTASGQQEGQSCLRKNMPRPTAPWCYYWWYWWYFTASLEAQVRQTRGTIQCQQQQQRSQSSSPSAGQEQMCFYGAATPRLHDAPGCTGAPVCSHRQHFHIAERGCCTVCSSSSIQNSLKIRCALL